MAGLGSEQTPTNGTASPQGYEFKNPPAAPSAPERPSITPSHVSAAIAAIVLLSSVAAGFVTLGSMRSRADATEKTAEAAKAETSANGTKIAVHDAQIKALEASLSRIEGKIDAALAGRKP